MVASLIMAVVTIAGILFLLWKLDIRKALWLDIPLDIAVSGLVLWLFSGTLGGAFAAVIAGALFSVVLLGLKKVMGYKRLTRQGRKFTWQEIKP